MLQMLTLEEWASEKYRSDPPSVPTLCRYAKQSLSCPSAMKQSRLWRVREDVELVGELVTSIIERNGLLLLQRILSDGSQTAQE